MAGSQFGRLFVLTSFGESHGPAIGGVVDGCPPGMPLAESDIQPYLDRRKPGKSRHETQRRESDRVQLLSGVFDGKTTGTPIAFIIANEDQRSKDYNDVAMAFRPGHADYTYTQKYGFRDYRGGGRSSARETAVRVAAGAIARKWLSLRYGIEIVGWLSRLGPIAIDNVDETAIATSAFFCPDPSREAELAATMDALRKARDSIGAEIRVVARHVPPGWGAPVYDRLDADIAYAMMSINAVKGVDIGAGFAAAEMRGSEHNDEMTPAGFVSNHAGGILGGLSSGQTICVRMALKPTASIAQPRRTVNHAGEAVMLATEGRHDPCVGIRATPIAEAMLALTLIDHALLHRAQCGDVVLPLPVYR